MTFKEIREEYEKEKDALFHKIASHSKKVVKGMRKTNMRSYDKYFDYISPRKNRWTYHFIKTPADAQLRVDHYCIYFTARSYAVIVYAVDADRIFYYTSHFFKRYYQREELERENIHETIKSFIRDNKIVASQPLQRLSGGITQVFGQMSTGVGLGYHHLDINLLEFRTFITNNMLKGEQRDLSKQLEEKFNIHVVRASPFEKNNPPA